MSPVVILCPAYASPFGESAFPAVLRNHLKLSSLDHCKRPMQPVNREGACCCPQALKWQQALFQDRGLRKRRPRFLFMPSPDLSGAVGGCRGIALPECRYRQPDQGIEGHHVHVIQPLRRVPVVEVCIRERSKVDLPGQSQGVPDAQRVDLAVIGGVDIVGDEREVAVDEPVFRAAGSVSQPAPV